MSDLPTIQISQPSMDGSERDCVNDVLESMWVTQGPRVAEFEQLFATHHQAPHAVAVTSCTTGLQLALSAWGIGPGDEVIVPAFTWISTANVVLHCGAKPIFVDIDPNTFNIDLEQVSKALSPRTKAIIPVHLFGLCADIDGLRALLPQDVYILEDAACATGARYHSRAAGTLGDAGVFSFHPRKIITTGEGGMITTNDGALAEKLVQMRNHGASISEEDRHRGAQPYSLPEFKVLGFNYRMTDLQGAIGVAQMGKLDRFIAERNKAAAFYTASLADIEWLHTPLVPEGYQHSWQAYVCRINSDQAPMSRNKIMEYLQHEWHISSRPGTHAVHTLDIYRQRYSFKADDFPIAWDCHQNAMALPLHNRMSEEDFDRVRRALHSL